MKKFIDSIINWYGALPYHTGKWRISNLFNFSDKTETVTVRRQGFTWELNLRDIIQRRIFFNVYEVNEIRLLRGLLKPGDVFLDVGANIGFYSLIASLCTGPEGSVYSFEPDKDIFRKLCGHIELNSSNNVRAYNIALADYDGEGFLCEKLEENSGWTHLVDCAGDDSRKVSAVKLDTFLRDNPVDKITLIKIDVEGYELEVLKGAQDILEKYMPEIIIELNSNALRRNKTEPIEVIKCLKSYGYEIKEISKNKLVSLGEVKNGEVKNLFAHFRG
ncbi:FkbM family methyltransferase [Verrucomicrobiota bacterium]